MNNLKITKLILSFFCVLYTVISVTPAIAQSETDLGASTPKLSEPLNIPNLSISIPGLVLRESTCTETECTTPWLADYISGLYKYGITVIIILAVITIMIGGVIWITSGGNDERIGDAKKWIGGSLIGVLIGCTSYLILNFVNPALTELSPLKVAYLPKVDLSQIIPPQEIQPTSPTAPRGTGTGKYQVPILYQYDYGSQIASTGCGPTSMTMVLNFYGVTKNVTEIAAESSQSGHYSYSSGWQTGMAGFKSIIEKYNLKTKSFGGGSSIEDALSLLEHGPVIVSMTSTNGCKCVYPRGNAHYVVFTGYENGVIYTNDPNPNNHSRQWEGQTIDTAKLDIAMVKKCCSINAGSITAYK